MGAEGAKACTAAAAYARGWIMCAVAAIRQTVSDTENVLTGAHPVHMHVYNRLCCHGLPQRHSNRFTCLM